MNDKKIIMANIFEILFGTGSKSVRRDANLRMTVDSNGNPVIEMDDGESITLSQEGSIDRISLSPDRFYHCGCSAELPIGGQCGEPGCRRISCQNCFGRCGECQKPLCLEHSRYFTAKGSERIRLCFDCYDALKRKQVIRAVAKSILAPFTPNRRKRD